MPTLLIRFLETVVYVPLPNSLLDDRIAPPSTVNAKATPNPGSNPWRVTTHTVADDTNGYSDGFVKDTGAHYGDRGNGFTYGWTQSGGNPNTHITTGGDDLPRNTFIDFQDGSIRGGGKVYMAPPSRMASPGMPCTTELASSCAIVTAPWSRKSLSSCAPSRPIPVSKTPTA